MSLQMLPQITVVYIFLLAFLGSYSLSFFCLFILLGVLHYYKLPQAQDEAVDVVLMSHKVANIAHRGGGFDAPENTLIAFREAKRKGSDGVEFDVAFTSDGVAVLLHDDTVDRTTDGTGTVSNLNLDSVRELNASAKHRNQRRYPNERIPTLEEAIEVCLELGLKMFIDVKGNAKQAAQALTDMYRKYPEMYKNAIVCSFYPDVVYVVKQKDPRIITGLTHRHRVLTRKVDGTEREGEFYKKLLFPLADILLKWSHYAWLWYLCGSSAFLINRSEASPWLVNYFKQRGVRLIVWTVNNAVEKQYVQEVLKCPYMTDTTSPDGCGDQVY